MLVDNPILNSPSQGPSHYWTYEEGQPKKGIGDLLGRNCLMFLGSVLTSSAAGVRVRPG